MIEITARVSALAPEAASALEAIAYFDRLMQGGAGVNAIVRGAAVLSGCTVVFVDQSHGFVRGFASDGTIVHVAEFPAAGVRTSSRDGSLRIAAEPDESRDEGLTALILERALLAISATLGRPLDERPRDRAAWVRLLVDENADADDRSVVLRSLGLVETTVVRMVAITGAEPRLAADATEALDLAAGRRAGIGRPVPAGDAASSWRDAVLALRLTAEGTPDDPGERVVTADDAGVLLDIVEALRDQESPPADVVALEHARAHASWVLETVDAVTRANSFREAAATVHVHHSTLQERLSRIEQLLGWSLATPLGRTRAYTALALRRALHGDDV